MVQGQRISVTKRSINLIKEYRSAMWLTDKDGKILNEEDPKFHNDALSAARYAMVSIIGKPDVKPYKVQQSPVLPYYPELGM